jgi:hypothetical protein
VLPLELGYSGRFEDNLQLASGFMALRLEPMGGKVIVARLEEWKRPDDPEESPTMAGVVAGAGAGFHRMSLETQRGSSRTKEIWKEL